MQYCEFIYKTKRRKTREVMIGNVGIGGNNPVRIQSMTTSSTRDAEATIGQIMRLADTGCEIARVTVQGIKEADTCEQIKNGLVQRGYLIPVVADIHFFPPAAMRVADFVDKIRVNPGNFVDKRASFKTIEYDDASYAEEIEKIEEKFTPLVAKCKHLKRAMRIGTNHGSLSDRIMNRYGDTPQGMVESALEFARVCIKNDYHDFCFSMKSSNPLVMVQAYRLLVKAMYDLNWDYPLHLGVTEAGDGEDGRIKSAMGIGSLLLDGIGDTIRVSLTEDPWLEIDPCKRLVQYAESYERKAGILPFIEKHRQIEEFRRRPVQFPAHVGLHRDGSVIAGITSTDILKPDFYSSIGCEEQLGRPKLKIASTDSLVCLDTLTSPSALQIVKHVKEAGVGIMSPHALEGAVPILSLTEATQKHHLKAKVDRFTLSLAKEDPQPYAVIVKDEPVLEWHVLEAIQPALIFLAPSDNRLHVGRQLFDWLQEKQLQIPVILNFSYNCSKEDFVIQAATEVGALLCDGLGEGIWLTGPYELDYIRSMSFNILQAARMRTFKTDFISCPSCGRTLFDLQEVTKRIKERTSHLPGVKIAIMGCIVNGPGEMADAHFGYVGSKAGMVDLYVGKECVEKNIPFDEADNRLVELIKANGCWKEPE